MTPQDLIAAAPVALAAFSTVHTFLDKHPRTQAVLAILAHAAGPLNLPALRDGVIKLARVIVAAADKKPTAAGALERFDRTAKAIAADFPEFAPVIEAVEHMDPAKAVELVRGWSEGPSNGPPPLPDSAPAPVPGTVKGWT